MTLPDYFLADLPPEATLTPAMIGEACQTLKRNRETYLAARSTQSLIELLAGVAQNWLKPENPFRRLALENGPAATGFSRGTLAAGLDAFFRRLTPESFRALLVQDLGHAHYLDRFIADNPETSRHGSGRGAIARGPNLLAHIAAGNIPDPTLTGIVLGVLTRSAQFVKCASGATLLPRLFAHSLYEAEPKLGACLEIAAWRGGHTGLERALFEEADCVTATGSDETLAAIRARLPAGRHLVGYGHRVSFAFVAAGALSGFGAGNVAARVATDVAAWDQLGCLSPHVVYVEQGGALGPEQFAERLAEELAAREPAEPRGELPAAAAATIASRRAFYEVRAAHSPETKMWQSKNSTAWTVVYESDPRFQLSCLHRFVYVKGVSHLTAALHGADVIRERVSTVGLAAPDDEAPELALQLSHWGATRVCPLGRMQQPPLTWRHDGRPPLGELVVWTDWER